jgi:hypothetical protein
MKTLKYSLSTSHCKPNSPTTGRLTGSIASAALLITLLASASSAQAANVLANPGFETGDPTGWFKYGTFDFNTTNNTYYNGGAGGSNVWIFDGRYSGKSYGQFPGDASANYSGEYQDVGILAGSVLSADCWVYTSTQDHIEGNNNAWIEVHFMDPGNNDLALYKTQVITPDPATLPLDNWYDYFVTNQVSPVVTNVSTLVAPAGTAKARYQIVFYQAPGNVGGSVFFDDARLNLISGPTPPSILNIYPSGTLLMQGTNKLAFTVMASATITNVQVILNGTDVSGGLITAGSTTSNSVTYPSLQSNRLYSVTINVKDANNLSSSVSRNFDTFDPNSFTWEAEDYDYNGGSFIDNPVLPSTSSPSPNSYYLKVGVAGIDYLENGGGVGTKAYRPSDTMATEPCGDLLRQKYVVAQQTDPTIQDYDVGWFDGNEWINFTRTYPTGSFNIWARMSSPNTSTLTLSQVTNGWGTISQSTVDLGTFSLLNGQGWGTYNWVPLTDPAGNLIQVTMGGTNTLRATTGGNNNAQFFMLVAANTNLPTITGIYPNSGLQSTNTFAFNANSAAGINTGSIKLTLNGVDVSSALVISGSPTARQVTYPFLAPNTSYRAIILVTDLNGQQANPTVNFDTFSGSAFLWEGVDYDYGGGLFFDEPSTNAYRGLGGTPDVDFHDPCNGGGSLYRIPALDCVATEVCGDFARAKFVPGVGTNYDLGFVAVGEWENYTRTYPSGTWNVYLRGARVGATITSTFGRVTNGWGTASQELETLGNFSISGTGGWQSYRYIPLVDSNNRLVDVPLAGTNTLRITGGDAANYNFFILTPPLKLKPSVSGGNFVLSFGTQPGFNYTVQSKTNLNDASWNAVSTVSGDGTTKSVSDPMTGPTRFYRLQVH